MSKNYCIVIVLILIAAGLVVVVPPFFAGFTCGILGSLSYYLGKGDIE